MRHGGAAIGNGFLRIFGDIERTPNRQIRLVTDQSLPLFGAGATPQVPWTSVFRIWWLVTWRATVGSIATGMNFAIAITVLSITFGWPPLVRTMLIAAISAVVVVIWHFVAVRIALEKIYADLRLRPSHLP
ncbi:MAG TPA: hypothetical protein VGR70_19630 [Stellaceae bacterium]|nr:hypothetical protein [Stellaceae bacterium]